MRGEWWELFKIRGTSFISLSVLTRVFDLLKLTDVFVGIICLFLRTARRVRRSASSPTFLSKLSATV